MSYNPHNLSVLAYANGFTLWHYVTNDNHYDLINKGYFDRAHDVLRVGDMIIVVAKSGGGSLFVSSVGPSAVNVSPPVFGRDAA